MRHNAEGGARVGMGSGNRTRPVPVLPNLVLPDMALCGGGGGRQGLRPYPMMSRVGVAVPLHPGAISNDRDPM